MILEILRDGNDDGESFWSFFNKYNGAGLYIMDEPEAALSPQRQLSLLIHIKEMSEMCVVSINIPDEVLLDLHEDKDDFTEYMKKMVALDLYKNKKVSLGYCANIAGMTKEEFIQFLSMNDVSIFSFDSEVELMEEVANV